MNFNLNAFGSHPDSAENRGCIKDADFLGQIDALLGGNPTEEQLEEVRKTLVGTNKAWMPKWLFDDLVNVPAGPEPEPQQPNDEIWYTSSDNDIIDVDQYAIFGDDITVVSNTYKNGKGVIKLSGDATKIRDLFSNQNKIKLVSISLPDSITLVDNYAFNNYSNLTSVTLGSGVTTIGQYAFKATGLTSIVIPDSVVTIETHAFGACTNLSSVILGNGITYLRNNAFESCTELTSVTIPDSVTTIGSSVFYGCTGLTAITLGSGVSSIGGSAFNSCTGLTSITINREIPPYMIDFAFNNTNDCPIYVPAGSVDTYKSSNKWSGYADRIQAIPTE